MLVQGCACDACLYPRVELKNDGLVDGCNGGVALRGFQRTWLVHLLARWSR